MTSFAKLIFCVLIVYILRFCRFFKNRDRDNFSNRDSYDITSKKIFMREFVLPAFNSVLDLQNC